MAPPSARRVVSLICLCLALAACEVAPADPDAGTETETETEGETGGLECFPVGDPIADATPLTITLTNSSDTPRWVKAGACQPNILRLGLPDTDEELADETNIPCTEAEADPNHEWCGDPCDGWEIVSPIRVDPGASYELVWDGHVWRHESIDHACSIDHCASSCGTGVAVEPGTTVVASVSSFSSCDNDGMPDEACDCPVDVPSCALGTSFESSLLDGYVKVSSLPVIHGEQDAIMLDLAG